MNFALINPRVWLEIAVTAIIVALCWWGYHTIYERGANSVQVKWDKEKMEVAQQSAKVTADALLTTKSLQLTIDKLGSQTNDQISALNSNLNSAIAGLRNRPDRPSQSNLSNNTADAKAGGGCTGSGLYRRDGEFLERLASDTAKLQLSLKACYAKYDAAVDALK